MTTDPIAEWLAALGTLTAAGMTAEDAREKILAYASLLGGKYPASAFTRESLEAVAAGLKFFPAYGELCDRLSAYWRENRPKSAGPAIAGPSKPGAGHWHGFIAARLVAGGDRAHLLSLARAYASPDELRGIMAAFYPDEAQADADHAAEVRRDKARGAEAVAKAVARSLSARKPAMKSAKPEPEAPPPVDPHAPGRPLTLRELHLRLVRFQREAAGNDPPPNVHQRIAWLQERIAALQASPEGGHA
jgi:hypothetical protein